MLISIIFRSKGEPNIIVVAVYTLVLLLYILRYSTLLIMASNINEFYRDQTVFITGGTGFLGKVLVEKLLRLNQIKKIYMLVRPKKGKSADERVDDVFNYPCFDQMKKINVDFKSKVAFISGNCEEQNLGLSAESEEVLSKETTIFIHAAANVKFDQPLRVAANINVRSTRDALNLAKKMPGLKAFVYVSTAYSNCPNSDIREEFYEPPMTAQQILSILDSINDETLEKITPKLIGKWPNCYTFTKSIAEDLIKTEGKSIPIAIVRPSIVTSCAEEPMPGWIDNLYGVIGVTLAAALGVLRSMHVIKDGAAQIVPCDYTTNAILAMIWDIADKKSDDVQILNIVVSNENKITWRRYMKLVETCAWDYPTNKIVWTYSFYLRENRLWHNIYIFFLHTCLAYFVDMILFCIGKEPLAVKNYRKIDNLLSLTSYFSTNTWHFHHDNSDKLWQKMSDEDKKMFKFDSSQIDWASYTRNMVIGGRVYLLNDPLETIPQSEKKVKFFLVLHYVVLGIFYYLLFLLFKKLYALMF